LVAYKAAPGRAGPHLAPACGALTSVTGDRYGDVGGGDWREHITGTERSGSVTRTFKRAARIVGGVFCIMLGIAGLFLPFLQGILLLVLGLSLLSPESERARRLLDWVRAYAPRKRVPDVGEDTQ
jgi:hypothetical protein